jgi:phosphomannomutase
MRRGPVAERARVGASIDLLGPYRDAVAERLDRAALRRAAPRVFYDAMHGAGSGVLDGVLRDVGVPVTALRAAPDPRFGGEAPDPAAARLDALRRWVSRGSGARIGLATDGDADRLVAVDASGRVLSSAESAALLVDHLARTGRIANGVALSVAVGSLVERVARSHGLAVHRGPIGFKHLARGLGTGAVDAAADESDGFAWGRFGRDKDGILAGCLLA